MLAYDPDMNMPPEKPAGAAGASPEVTPLTAMHLAMDAALQEALKQVRAAHGARWDSVGQRPGEIGWWATREVGTAARPVTHHIVCRTLAELDAELTDIEKPDEDIPVTE